MGSDFRRQAYRALLAGARDAHPGIRYDERGYASKWEDNLIAGLRLDLVAGDLAGGAGRELGGKLCAAHSSAALAVNTFGPWREEAAALRLAGAGGFTAIRFEAKCPTGLSGTPPHLDLLAEGKTPVAVESKCTEWMEPKDARFAQSYDGLRGRLGDSPWFEQIQRLRHQPNRYEFLDASQLVKHALGLQNRFASREVRLVYLYWEPLNAGDWPECGRHRAEAEDLAACTAGSIVQLLPLSYGDLCTHLARVASTHHLAYLLTRYGRAA